MKFRRPIKWLLALMLMRYCGDDADDIYGFFSFLLVLLFFGCFDFWEKRGWAL